MHRPSARTRRWRSRALSWALETSGRDIRQTAYRIRVASDAGLLSAATADLWDSSGRVESDRCFEVAYAGKSLHSGQRAWWSVQVWDNRDHTSAAAEPTWFEMGLLESRDWQAQWLAIEGQAGNR